MLAPPASNAFSLFHVAHPTIAYFFGQTPHQNRVKRHIKNRAKRHIKNRAKCHICNCEIAVYQQFLYKLTKWEVENVYKTSIFVE
ncbi:MAG: hypothetical protein L6U16_04870 [Porphyromonadaceae bacterium]|nr:MAG: hypothetical protein L6U16_04870 [Porphyromonadaceae bacterium]